jgi:hypothetical protein
MALLLARLRARATRALPASRNSGSVVLGGRREHASTPFRAFESRGNVEVPVSSLKRYRVFFCFCATGRSVDADDAIEMNEADIYSELLGQLTEEGDFIGLMDANEVTLQVMYEKAADRFWVEIPCPDKGGSYGRHLHFDELVDLFKGLPANFSPSELPSLVFDAWG